MTLPGQALITGRARPVDASMWPARSRPPARPRTVDAGARPRDRIAVSPARRPEVEVHKKYWEEQIIGALREANAGAKVEDVCRRLGISKVTFYRRKEEFSGMQLSDAKRLRQLEDENRRLKQMMADQALGIQALKAVARRKW